jgi:peptidoglycan/LPS O-acetylase OafA/YrhL
MVKRLLTLNGIAVLFAVGHHAIHWVLTGMFWWTDRYRPVSVPNFDLQGGPIYHTLVIADQFMSTAVPIFLLISGYFISISTKKDEKTVSWDVILRRTLKLIIPYLIWSAVIIGLRYIEGNQLTLSIIIRMIITGGATGPYYYIPLLILLLFISPILVPLARFHWKILLFSTFLVQIPITIIIYGYSLSVIPNNYENVLISFADFNLLVYGFWFALGLVFGFHIREISINIQKYRQPMLLALVITIILSLLEFYWLTTHSNKTWIAPQTLLFNKMLALTLILNYLARENLLKLLTRFFNFLGKQSYGIYLIHVIPLEITARLTYHFAPALLKFPLTFFVVIVIIGLMTPLLLMEITTRSTARRFCSYIFG